MLGPVYTNGQHQHCHNSAIMILFSLQTMESLQNGVTTHFQARPLFSMRTKSLASCRVVAALTLTLRVNGPLPS